MHPNGLENFWSLVESGMSGIHVSLAPCHLLRYLDEAAFRYNDHKMSDGDRFEIVVREIVRKRLPRKSTYLQPMSEQRALTNRRGTATKKNLATTIAFSLRYTKTRKLSG